MNQPYTAFYVSCIVANLFAGVLHGSQDEIYKSILANANLIRECYLDMQENDSVVYEFFVGDKSGQISSHYVMRFKTAGNEIINTEISCNNFEFSDDCSEMYGNCLLRCIIGSEIFNLPKLDVDRPGIEQPRAALFLESEYYCLALRTVGKESKSVFRMIGANDGITGVLRLWDEYHQLELNRSKDNVGSNESPADGQSEDDRAGLLQIFKTADNSTWLEEMKKAIEAGADVNAADEYGVTALMWAAQDERVDIVKTIINAGADVNARNWVGKNVLMYACYNSNPEVIKALLSANPDVDAKSKYGQTALMFAATSMDSDIATSLIEAGADVNARDNEGGTPLIWAVKGYANPDVISILLDAGADPKHMDDYGRRAIDYGDGKFGLKESDAYQKLKNATFAE